jgi:hypothetical protein
MVYVGPVRVLYLRDEVRLQPAAFGHLVGRETLTLPTLVALGQVRKRAGLDFERVETLENARPKSRDEPVAHTRNVDEVVALVIADDERVEVLNLTGNGGGQWATVRLG